MVDSETSFALGHCITVRELMAYLIQLPMDSLVVVRAGKEDNDLCYPVLKGPTEANMVAAGDGKFRLAEDGYRAVVL